MTLKLLHVADVHLDAPFGWLGRKGPEQRRQLAATFRAAVDLAIREDVDAVLVAGDLFDSNSPAQSSIDLVRAELRRLARPAFILPGTHDCLDAGSVYRRVSLADLPNVHLFDAERRYFDVPHLGLAVHARANLTKTSAASPLADLAPLPSARYNVALAHGSLEMPSTEDDYPLNATEIAASGFDYLALGHWHRCQDCSKGRTTAWYCGPLEPLKPDDSGAALVVEIPGDAAPARVTRRDLAARRARSLTIPLDAARDREAIRELIASEADPALVLRVTLTGVRALGQPLDVDALATELAGEFFQLRIDDQTHPALDEDDLAAFDEGQVIGKFARLMRRRIDGASDEIGRRRAESALQIGLALLQNRRVF